MSDAPSDREVIAAAAARWVTRCDAGLTAAERIEFDRWCSSDPRHAAAVQNYSAAWSVLDRPRDSGAILRELGARKRRRRRIAATAMAALTIIATTFLPWRSDPVETRVAVATPRGVLITPEKRVLPDGSIVELKSGAEIVVDFSGVLRRVTLVRGEAHFQVAKNEARPFSVDTGVLQVRAVGTAFSVQRDPAQIEVVVTEGRIAIEKQSPVPDSAIRARPEETQPVAAVSDQQTIAFADAGQRVVIAATAEVQPPAVVAVSADELAERLAWRAPRVEFSGTPLAEAVAMMNRSAAGRNGGLRLMIDSASTGLAKEPVSGMFRADNTETFVRMLELSLGIQVERKGNQIVLKKSGS